MTKYTQTQLENLVHRLRLVGAYDSVIADSEIDTCLEAARVIEEYADFLAEKEKMTKK